MHANSTILTLYVNAMLLVGKEPISSDLQKELKARFDIDDLSLIQYFLGMIVTCDVHGNKINITQEVYIR